MPVPLIARVRLADVDMFVLSSDMRVECRADRRRAHNAVGRRRRNLDVLNSAAVRVFDPKRRACVVVADTGDVRAVDVPHLHIVRSPSAARHRRGFVSRRRYSGCRGDPSAVSPKQ